MSRFQVDKNGWLCSQCNLYNDILTIHCKDCNADRPLILTQHAINTVYTRNPNRIQDLTLQDYSQMTNKDDDKIEMHTKFFNKGYATYFALDLAGRREFRDELANVIFQARATMNAVDKVDRETRESLSPDGKQWLVSNADVNSEKLIEGVKERKARMTKADKLKEAMESLGLEEADVNLMIGKVEKTATVKGINSINFVSDKKEKAVLTSELCRIERHSECIGSFRTNGTSNVCKCSCHDAVITEPEVKSEPFNPSKLFG